MAAMQLLGDSPISRLVATASGHSAFVPDPLPRVIDLPGRIVMLLDEASRSVATLAGIGETLPNPQLLIQPFLRREAVLSSKIEGTQSSLDDLLRFEADRSERGDVLEVANYIAALQVGMERLGQLPLSPRLFDEVHATLLTGVRGQDKRPGEQRDVQVYIGAEGSPVADARFIPPPPAEVGPLLDDLAEFLNQPAQMPPLIQCAMMHYQFETIHPYRDGNGRVGRLLIILFLQAKGVMRSPLLYLSAFFERNRQLYYDRLFQLSQSGDWTAWLAFFLQGVIEESQDALHRSRLIRDLYEQQRKGLQDQRATASMLRLLDEFFVSPYLSVPLSQKRMGLTYAGVQRVMQRLEAAGVIRDFPGTWPKLYLNADLAEILRTPRVTGPSMEVAR